MQDETHPAWTSRKRYTVVVRPDPPTIPISEEGTIHLRKLADQCSQFEGYEEVARDERFYQVEVLLRSRD